MVLEGDGELQPLLEKLRLYQLRATMQLEVRRAGRAGLACRRGSSWGRRPAVAAGQLERTELAGGV